MNSFSLHTLFPPSPTSLSLTTSQISGMGGCCSSSRKHPLHGRPIYYYCPVSEEHESLTSHDSVTTALTAGFLIDLNVDTSDPDTFRSPPAPLPFDMVLGCPRSPVTESEAVLTSGDKATSVKPRESYCKSQKTSILTSSGETGVELMKSDLPKIQKAEEEDACPTCLEEYDTENPKILTKCCHHFHLSCILEWMERSDTCPICDKEMIYKDF